MKSILYLYKIRANRFRNSKIITKIINKKLSATKVKCQDKGEKLSTYLTVTSPTNIKFPDDT
ncbi:MAG TPA: hypothetical protein EYH00_00185 [Archaeoglobus profundus]|nr:hypothetical protein [Archaeoglobus profundus]